MHFSVLSPERCFICGVTGAHGDDAGQTGIAAVVIVTWIKDENWDWHALETVTLWRIFCTGVYLVWYEGTPGRVVCMGQGTIATELDRVRRDESLMRFKSNGRLLVTWAAVSPLRIDGVERYLRKTWPPLVAQACADADATPIEVNSPAWLRAFL